MSCTSNATRSSPKTSPIVPSAANHFICVATTAASNRAFVCAPICPHTDTLVARNGSISHHSTNSISSSITGGAQIPEQPISLQSFNMKSAPEPEYEFDHADLEDPIDPCPDPVQIPDPRITLYPEHPAITSKSTAQTFTCLLSVEIPNRRARQYEAVLTPISEASTGGIKSPMSRSLRAKSPAPLSVKTGLTSPNPKHL